MQQPMLINVTEEVRQPIIDRDMLARALKAPHVALDIETETRWPGTGPKKDYGLSYCAEPLYISLAWRESGHDGQPEGLQATVLGAPFDEKTKAALRQLVDGSHTIVMHNAVFDTRALSRVIGGKTPENIWCTATMARLLHPVNNGSYNLVAVAAQLGVETTKEQREMKGERKNLHKLPVAQVVAYAMEDALVTCLISEKQMALVDQQVLGDEGRTYFLADWECRAVREYCRMAAQGMKLNVPYVQQCVLELHETVKGTAARLKADGLANPGSTQQRAEYIYETKGIPRPDPDINASYYTAGGNLSTKADVIEALLEQFPEHKDKLADLVTHLGVYRMMSNLESLLEHAAIDGRIHSLVSIGTDTSRRSASHPQTQNWKMTAEDDDPAGDMCGVVIGSDGFSLVEVDLQGAELWMTTLVSGDDAFAAALHSGDFHSAMAEVYFGDEFRRAEGATRKLLRRKAKIFTFAMLYGMGGAGLAKAAGVPVERAYELLRALEVNFPTFAQAKEIAEQAARKQGYIKLWTGRRVPVDPNRVYTTWDYLCQGGVAELVKRAIVLISEAYQRIGLRSRVALDMHDALILEIAHDEWNDALIIASEAMSSVVPQDLNERTDPPVRWTASPDLEENKKKWGKGQWHPGDVAEKVEPPVTKPITLPVAPETFQPVDPGPIPLIQIEFEDLAISWQLRVRRGVKFSELTHTERGEIRSLMVSLWNRVDQEFGQTFPVHLPVQGEGGQVVLSQPLNVDLVNHAKVPRAWLMAAEQGVDTVALIGLTLEELKAEAVARQARIVLLEKRVQWCMDWVETLVEEEGPTNG